MWGIILSGARPEWRRVLCFKPQSPPNCSTPPSTASHARSFCEDPRTLYGKGLPDPACALYFDGTLYDNVVVRRRGQSSLGWPKPKLRVASERGRIFAVGRDYDLKEFNFNSEWAEPGENSFMRETLAWRALREMGVPSALSYQVGAGGGAVV